MMKIPRRIKTQDQLDLWVRKNIIEFTNDRNIQLAVARKRCEIIKITGKI